MQTVNGPAAPAPASPSPQNGAANSAAAKAQGLEFVYDDGFDASLWARPQEDVEEAPRDEDRGIEGPIPDAGATPQQQGYSFPLEASEYPQASRFVPAATGNYRASTAPRGINRIVIHITDGGANINGPISWFQNPQAKVSAHYIVGQDGEVAQMVKHNDVAWHASRANGDSIGVEHVANTRGLTPTESEYCASAALVNWLCQQYGIPMDRDHILGHSEADPRTTHRGCPNAVWDWNYYMGLVTSGSCYPRTEATQSLAYGRASRPMAAMAAPFADEIPLDPGNGGRSIGPDALEMGDIILSTTDEFVSDAIRAFSGAPVSHSMIYTGDGEQVVEAIGGGVVFRPLSEALAVATVAVAFRHPGLTEEQRLRIRDYVGRQIGRSYNYWGIVKQARFRAHSSVCRLLSGERRASCENFFGSVDLGTGDNQTFFCSELVVAAYNDAGAPLTSAPPIWNSPGDLAELRLSGSLSYVGHLKAPPLAASEGLSARNIRYNGNPHQRTNGHRYSNGRAQSLAPNAASRAQGYAPYAFEAEDATTRAQRLGPEVVSVVETLRAEGLSDSEIISFLNQIGAGSGVSAPAAASTMAAHARALDQSVRFVLPGAYVIEGWKARLLLAALTAQTGPAGMALFQSLPTLASKFNVTIGIGPALGAGLLGGGSLGAGIVFTPSGGIGFYGSVEESAGLIASISLTIQVTIVKGGIGNFAGEGRAVGFSAGEEIVGGAAALLTPTGEFQGVSFQLGIGAGLSPIDVYTSAQTAYSTISEGMSYRNGYGNNYISPRARALADQVMVDALPLSLKEADYADELTDELDVERAEARPGAALTNEEIYRIIREVAIADSGDAVFGAALTDRDYENAGVMPSRPFGLAIGFALFTQGSGRLGSVLRLMNQRDPAAFAEIFGANAEALLAATNAGTAAERLQPVGGEPLSSPTWIERFKRAAEAAAFQFAQNEEAIEGQFRPMLHVVYELGLTTDRAMAMAYDRVVTQGLGGGLRWIVQTAGPLGAAAQRNHALQMLGFGDLAQFQASPAGQAMGLKPDGRFTHATHAALVGDLRRQGAATLPLPDEMAWRLYAAATGTAKRRLRRLLDSSRFTDVVYFPPNETA